MLRPALRYYGGKSRLAPWIISHFPPHTTYVEPFGGAASVLLNKPRSRIEVYNDLNKRVVNFFTVLRQQPEALLTKLRLTPYSREEFARAKIPSSDPLEDARRLVVLSGQGNRGVGCVDPGGWRWMKNNSRICTLAHDWAKMSHLIAIAERFAMVQIENQPAIDVIRMYDTPFTLFYVDPPYLPDTRNTRWSGDLYVHDMTEQDHIQLSTVLHQVRGNVILSGYQHPLYYELYSDWPKRERAVTLHARRSFGRRVVEVLWLSPNINSYQPALF